MVSPPKKMERLAQSLGIESLSAGQVSEITKDLNNQVEWFRTRPLEKNTQLSGLMLSMRKFAVKNTSSAWLLLLSRYYERRKPRDPGGRTDVCRIRRHLYSSL